MPFGVQNDFRRQALPRPEILSYPLETVVIDSIVVNATGVTADVSGPYVNRRYLVAGTVLSKRADNQYERYTASTSSDSGSQEVQTVTLTNATGGTFTLTYSSQTTAAIPYNETAANVRLALEALSNLAPGDITVTGSAGGPYSVTFLSGANVSQMTANGASLTGTSPTVGVVTATPGGVQNVAGVLYDTVEFADGTNASDEPVAMLRRNVSFVASKIVDFNTYASAIRTALPTCEFI